MIFERKPHAIMQDVIILRSRCVIFLSPDSKIDASDKNQ